MSRPSRPTGVRRSSAVLRHLLLLGLAALGFSGCGSPPPEEGVVAIQLIDRFKPELVEGAVTPEAGEPTVLRFDGSGIDAEVVAGPGVERLRVEDGKLTGRAATATPVVRLTLPEPAGTRDRLHSVVVRAAASAGTNLELTLSRDEEPDVEGLLRRAAALPWPFKTPLVAGDGARAYTMRVASSFLTGGVALSDVRHVLLRPTDAPGARFEIESVELVFRRRHLAGIPSGLGWQGLGEIYRESLVTRAGERVAFELDLPSRPWLDLAVGTVEETPVTFRVAVEPAGGDAADVLTRTASTPGRWETSPVDLAEYAGRRVRLVLAAASEKPQALAFWGAPAIRNRREPAAARTAGAGGGPAQGVILLIADTLRRDHLDAYGYGRPTAPVLRGMARDGALFRDPIAQGTWTKVSVPSILSGIYPASHGIVDFDDRLPSAAVTLAEAFRGAGYATFATSSVPFSGQLTNLHQGVEELHERGSLELPEGQSSSKTSRQFMDRFLGWLEAHRDTPFFARLHVFDPHSPFEPYPPYDALWGEPDQRQWFRDQVDAARPFIRSPLMQRFGMPSRDELAAAGVDIERYVELEIGWYDGSIRAMDVEIGRLLEKIRQLGLEGRVVVAFTADHGEEFLEHGRHWHGHSVYGEMTDIPLILWGPGILPAGVVVEPTVQSVDIMPTLLDLAGLPPAETVQGQSLVPLIEAVVAGEAPTAQGWRPRAAFSERVLDASSRARAEGEVDSYAIILDGWRLIRNLGSADHPEFELYRHAEDPLNQEDLAAAHPEVVSRLAADLDTWRRWAERKRLPSDEEAAAGVGAEELERLRSLGYVQ